VGSDSDESLSKSKEQEEYLVSLEAALAEGEEQPIERPPRQYYFILGSAAEDDDGWGEEIGFTEKNDGGGTILVLPQEDLLVHAPLPPTGEPQIDYNKSHILTSDEFVASLEAKAACKQALLEEAQVWRIAAEENKEMSRLEKLEKEKRCLERAEERIAKKRERQYWDKVKHDGWSDKLHEIMTTSIKKPCLEEFHTTSQFLKFVGTTKQLPCREKNSRRRAKIHD
jgi:hypothetical protein